MPRLALPSLISPNMRALWRGIGSVIVATLGIVSAPAFAVTGAADSGSHAKSQNFDYVILALSWSPTYCGANAKRANEQQCQNPANRGFVVHGLWPQANDGARLRCSPDKGEFSKALFERALEIFPDLKLAQSQWQRHGQCFGFAPDAYLERAGAARAKLVIPERFRAIDKPVSLSPDEVSSSFRNSNPGLTSQSLSGSCRASQLVEMLVCRKSDLSGFESCPQVATRTCRATTIELPSASRP